MLSEMCKRSQRNRHQQNREHGDGPAPPTLFAFAEKEGQEQESENCDHRPDEQSGSLHRGRQEREHGVKPKEEEIRARRGLNNSGIRWARRAERTEVSGAYS